MDKIMGWSNKQKTKIYNNKNKKQNKTKQNEKRKQQHTKKSQKQKTKNKNKKQKQRRNKSRQVFILGFAVLRLTNYAKRYYCGTTVNLVFRKYGQSRV